MYDTHTSRHDRHGRGRNRRSDQWNKPAQPRRPARLAVVEPVALNRLRRGVVVWAHIPFAERDEEKTRPAVVVAREGRNIHLLPISTSPARFRRAGRFVELNDLAEAGLSRASAVQQRPVTIDSIEIISVSGELSDADRLAVFGPSLLASAS